MKSNLITYYVFAFVQLLVIETFAKYLFSSVMNGEIFYTLLWSIVFFSQLKEVIDNHKEFMTYYPHFENRWLFQF